MAVQLKGEAYTLVRGNVTTETDIAVSTGEGLQNIWEYLVPVGHTYVFNPQDTFSAYLETSAPAEAGAGSDVDVVIQDAAKQSSRSLVNPVRYAQIKEFQDRDKMLHLDIEEGKEMVAREGERVIVRGNLNDTLDASDSYMALTCTRIRKTILD